LEIRFRARSLVPHVAHRVLCTHLEPRPRPPVLTFEPAALLWGTHCRTNVITP